MTIALLLPFLFTAAPRSAASPVKAEDRLIVPAVRVGAITSRTSEADLVKVYGASHVRKRDFFVFLDPGRAIVPESLLGDRDISSQLPETIELMPQVGMIQADLP